MHSQRERDRPPSPTVSYTTIPYITVRQQMYAHTHRERERGTDHHPLLYHTPPSPTLLFGNRLMLCTHRERGTDHHPLLGHTPLSPTLLSSNRLVYREREREGQTAMPYCTIHQHVVHYCQATDLCTERQRERDRPPSSTVPYKTIPYITVRQQTYA